MTGGIQWRQVLLLLMLEVSVAISWIAYHEYQPEILAQFGFSEHAIPFAFLQAIILTLTPPIAGHISDNIRNKGGERLPVINIGVSVVAMIFMSVAATVYWDPSGWIVYLVPVFVALWLISMNVFRSPAISLVETFVPQQSLPKVIAVFVLAFDLIYALEPSIVDLIQTIGAPLTFSAGGVLVFASGYFLMRSFKKYDFDENHVDFNNDTEDGKSDFMTVVVIGLAYGLVVALVFKWLPGVFEGFGWLSRMGLNANYLVSFVIGLSAFAALYMGKLAETMNLNRMFTIGLLTSLLSFAIFLWAPGLFGFLTGAAILIFSFAMMSVSALPQVFYKLSAAQTVLGVGLYYSAIEFCGGIGDILLIY